MYNKSRLIVRVKRFKSKKGSDFINAQTSFDAVSILNVYEAALTYIISVNTLMTLFDTVKLLLVIFV